jgi:phosphoribosylaminoimidazole carboxylase
MAINNATNAGLLSVRILTASVPRLMEEMDRYMKRLESEVHAKVERVERIGWAQYEAEMKR